MDLSPAHLLSLGMFVFGMDTLAYDDLQRRVSWRHPISDRFGARPVAQYAGPGDETVTISGLLVPEIAGTYGAMDVLEDMGNAGGDYPLLDGQGRVLGYYRIVRFEETHRNIMAGGVPRQKAISIELERVD